METHFFFPHSLRTCRMFRKLRLIYSKHWWFINSSSVKTLNEYTSNQIKILSDYPFFKKQVLDIITLSTRTDSKKRIKLIKCFRRKLISFGIIFMYSCIYIYTVVVDYTEIPKCWLLTYSLCNVQYFCNFPYRIMFTYPKVNMMVVEFIRGLLFTYLEQYHPRILLFSPH